MRDYTKMDAAFQGMDRYSSETEAIFVASMVGRAHPIVGLVQSDVSPVVREALELASYPVVEYPGDAEIRVRADVVVVDCIDDTNHLKQAVDTHGPIPLIALVGDLTAEANARCLQIGAASTISIQELHSARLSIVVGQSVLSHSRHDPKDTAWPLFLPAAISQHVNDAYAIDDAAELERLRDENKSLAALNAVAHSLMDRLELAELLQRIAETVLELTGCADSYISVPHESGAYLEMVAAAGGFTKVKGYRHGPGIGVAGTAWVEEKLIYADNYSNHPSTILQFSDIKVACAIPIMIEGTVAGVIGVTDRTEDHLLGGKKELLIEFSRLAALAIENATLLQNTAIELKRTDTTRQLSQAIYSSSSFESLFDRISVTLVDVFALKMISIFRLDDAKQKLKSSNQWAVSELGIVPVDPVNSIRLCQGLCDWALHNRKIINITRNADDDRDDVKLKELRREAGLGATIVLPLVHDSAGWGVIVLYRGVEQRDFSESDINLLDVLSNQISTAIHRHGLLQKIQHQAYHDSLTDLPNRFKFESDLEDQVAKSTQDGSNAALIFIDLDGFKKVNDTLGHAMGDELLKHVSRRLARSLKSTDVLARMGGDEFAVLITDFDSYKEAIEVAERLVYSLRAEFSINGARLKIGGSAGLSFVGNEASSANELLKNADIAMYKAKDDGKNRVHCFSPALSKRYQKRVEIELDLQSALGNDEFELYYQPQVKVSDNTVDGVEALIRWNHPTKGLVSPAEFIPIAEECGLISDIGNWVLIRACEQMAQWVRDGNRELSLAVNISAEHFNQPGFTAIVLDALQTSGFQTNSLHLEVTESVVMHDVSNVATILGELRQLGVSISVDDFGTGYSSLQYLQDLPLDILKVDRAFVQSLDVNCPQNSVTNTIIYLARSFGLKTVAEGVETIEQLSCIKALGCDWIQGYVYSRPVPINELASVLQEIEAPTDVLLKAG